MAAILPRQWRDQFAEACDAPIQYRKDTSSEALEVGGLRRFARPWTYSRKFQAALLAEYIGMAIFQIYGGNAPDSVAAFGNGITLVVLVYATANVSGGHLNPAVSFAQCLTGHISWRRGSLYTLSQILGGISGAIVQALIMPGVRIGHGDSGPGCFTPTHEPFTTKWQLFGWEVIMTFTLVSVVYAVAVAKPGFGPCAPLAIGFTLFASAFVGGPYSGAALNPARVLGPSMVFHCYWSTVPIYIVAELLGAALAAFLTMPLYGFGTFISQPKALETEHQHAELLPKTAARSDTIQMSAIASSYDSTPATRTNSNSGPSNPLAQKKSVSFRTDGIPGPLGESRVPPLSQTAGYLAQSGGTSRSFAPSIPDAAQPGASP